MCGGQQETAEGQANNINAKIFMRTYSKMNEEVKKKKKKQDL